MRPRSFIPTAFQSAIMRMHNRVLLAAVVCLGAACTGAPPDTGSKPVITDSAGITIVENVGAERDAPITWRVDSVPVTRIGHDENEVQAQFSFIRGATRLSNGNVVVAVQSEVLIFGPDGKFIKTVARSGNGPGEFRYVGTMLRLPGDSILVSQAMVEGGRKIAIFSGDGALIREERPDMDAWSKLGRWDECESRVFRDRSWLACRSDSTIPVTELNRPSKLVGVMSTPGPGHLRQLKRWHLIPASLERTLPIGVAAGIEQFGVRLKNGRETFVMHPFYSRSLITDGGDPRRIAIITNPDYNIELWTPDGRLDRIIRRKNGRRAPNADELAALPELLKSMNRGRNDDSEAIASVPTPDSLPSAYSLNMTPDGYLAVGREGFLPPYHRTVYDIFSPAGTYLGEFHLPSRTYLMEMGSDYILALRRSEDDVPVIEVFALPRNAVSKDAAVPANK